MTEVVVRVEHLSFSRGQRKIFDDVSFIIPRGEVVAVMGQECFKKKDCLILSRTLFAF